MEIKEVEGARKGDYMLHLVAASALILVSSTLLFALSTQTFLTTILSDSTITGHHRNISLEEFRKASAYATELALRCRSTTWIEGCITEECPALPFGFDGRPADHPPQLVGNNCEPWMRREVIILLNRLIKPWFKAMEWSSGSSTLWLSKRVRSLISVESDKEWGERVRSKLGEIGAHNVTFHIIQSTESGPDWAYGSDRKGNYEAYINVEIPTTLIGNLDLVSVDGRASGELSDSSNPMEVWSCWTTRSVRRIKPGISSRNTGPSLYPAESF
jgi:hypothetical protein